MNYLTIGRTMLASGALLLGLMYACVWLMNRRAWASLAFAAFAFGVVGLVIAEIGLTHSLTPQEWLEWVWWVQFTGFFVLVGLVVFVHLHFKAGRTWLMWLIVGLRLLVVTLVIAGVSMNYTRVDSIARVTVFGEEASVLGSAVTSPWQMLGSGSIFLLLVYLADVSITLWRQGTRESRRRAITVAVAIFLSMGTIFLYLQLTLWGRMRIPALMSPPFIVLLGVMAFEMSRETLRASQLARELKASDNRLQFAAAAAGLGLWTWDSRDHHVWATPRARFLFGLGAADSFDIEQMRSMIHPDDIGRVESVLLRAAVANEEIELQFRVCLPDGVTRWLLARGRSQADTEGALTAIQGVLRDVTDQVGARAEIEELRRELAHAGRVSALGTLSSSMAHELNQPLGAIMLNAEAAELLLNRPNPDLQELRNIVQDILRDDRRAADVIDRLRKLLKRQQLELAPLAVEGLIQDIAVLLGSDAVARGVTLLCERDAAQLMVLGDRIHLSQVLINLVMNAMDAVADQPASQRLVSVRARLATPGCVEITVSDSGPGVAAELAARIFDPFFTTKSTGMGMGLSVSRTIVDSHSGRLWVENGIGGGATFLLTLPAV